MTADYKDFASKYATSGGDKRQSKSTEGVAELMERIRVWLSESPASVINIQTVDHHAYYRSAMDAPGFSQSFVIDVFVASHVIIKWLLTSAVICVICNN